MVVFANGNYNDQEINYSLTVSYDKNHVVIKENYPYKDTVIINSYNYYTFSLISLINVKNIYF